MKKLQHIRILLPSIIICIAVLMIGTAGLRTYVAWQARQAAAQFILVNEAEEHLLAAAGGFAIERGMTVVALGKAEPASADRFDELAKRRETADQALEDAVEDAQTAIKMLSSNKIRAALDKAEQSHTQLKVLRKRVDEELTKPLPERSKDVAQGIVPATTNLIDEVRAVSTLLEVLAEPPQSDMGDCNRTATRTSTRIGCGDPLDEG